ncbi:MAG TPA: hypothetical protein VGM39_19700 [Kofleriaceae bacterium]
MTAASCARAPSMTAADRSARPAALRAAAWVVGKSPGRYSMLDVLGFGP